VSETRKLAAILVSDVVGYSRLTGADEDRTLARLRTLRSDLFDPTIAVHHGRIVKRTGDGSIIEFRSVVDAVNCAIEVQRAMVERNAGVPADRTRVLAGQDWTRLTVSHPMAKRGGVGPFAKGIREGLPEGAKRATRAFDVARCTKRVDRN
jgi:class 3 adenylate cyclase